ncbi:MAG: hypothetical protein K2Q12_05625 [Rickettsiales bacterium]|mgnify:FL=1|nr:hypothetical protein [Rickettsiales bacterium]
MFTDLIDVRDAFVVLSPSRPFGFGVGCIPLSEIESFVRLYEVEDIDRFLRLIRAMDTAYVEKINQRNERKNKA